MITSMFSVYDSKTAAYLPPFYMATKPAAIRAISDAMADENHAFAKHPEDYSLFFLGTYDDTHAKFALEETPQALCVLVELISPYDTGVGDPTNYTTRDETLNQRK